MSSKNISAEVFVYRNLVFGAIKSVKVSSAYSEKYNNTEVLVDSTLITRLLNNGRLAIGSAPSYGDILHMFSATFEDDIKAIEVAEGLKKIINTINEPLNKSTSAIIRIL